MKHVGILVHGRHVMAHGWERLVWGDTSANKMGSLPKMVQVALEEGLDNIAVVVFGTGASERDGIKEADCMKQVLLDFEDGLIEFPAIRDHRNYYTPRVHELIAGVVTETLSQNTNEEIANAAQIFAKYDVTKVIQISCASHLPRCVKTTSELREKGDIPANQIWSGVADDMTFGDLGAGATAILEPPHRGDDPMLKVNQELWPSNLVPQLFRLPFQTRVHALSEWDRVLRFIKSDKSKVA